MSDCIQLIANFVSLHFCIFSERALYGSLQETCLSGQVKIKKPTVGASLLANNLRAPLFILRVRVIVGVFREQARSYRGLKRCEIYCVQFSLKMS